MDALTPEQQTLIAEQLANWRPARRGEQLSCEVLYDVAAISSKPLNNAEQHAVQQFLGVADARASVASRWPSLFAFSVVVERLKLSGTKDCRDYRAVQFEVRL